MADEGDLNSPAKYLACGFESHCPHHWNEIGIIRLEGRTTCGSRSSYLVFSTSGDRLMAEAKVIEVVGGIIRRGDKFLLGKRPLGKSQGEKWEFIGGKIESGETPEQALARECMEEIALPIIKAKIRTSVTHAYPDRTIHLTLIDCEPAPNAEPKALEHAALGWFTAADALKLDFCPADIELLPVVFNINQ